MFQIVRRIIQGNHNILIMEHTMDGIIDLGIIGVILGLAVLALYIWSIVWAYRDADKRGSSALLVAIMVAFLAWPLGIVIWLLIRPKEYKGTA